MKSLKVSDYEAISKLDGVRAASPMTNGSYVVIYQNKNWTTSVSGVSYNYLDVNNWSMKSGRFLSEKNVQNRERVAVVGKTVVKNLFGDEDPVGAEIRVKIFHSVSLVFLIVRAVVLWVMTKMIWLLSRILQPWNG